jgi:methionyl-tRNA formyltransferase
MNVLFLGPSSPLIEYLEQRDRVTAMTGPLTPPVAAALGPDWTVSYGYRHILSAGTLGQLGGRAINLHISYLPWNRGADPNLWSVLDRTPNGVSIHHIDEGVDTGDLIAQRRIPIVSDDTLATSYQRLQAAVQSLFVLMWPVIRDGCAPRYPQPSGGSYHRKADRKRVEHLLNAGWDTPVSRLAGTALAV